VNNNILINKNFMVIGFEEKESNKGNKYINLTIADVEGNIHRVYVPSNLVEVVKGFKPKDDKGLRLNIVYRGKYPKIELVEVLAPSFN
jgi:hypothetical protein